MSSFQSATNKLMSGKYQYDVPIKIDNWELIISAPREAEQLPVIKHALYIP